MSVIGSTDIEMIKCDGVNSTVANYLFRKAELNPVCRVGGAGGGRGRSHPHAVYLHCESRDYDEAGPQLMRSNGPCLTRHRKF